MGIIHVGLNAVKYLFAIHTICYTIPMQIQYEAYTLSNGVEVLFIPSDIVNSVNIHSVFLHGSSLETDKNQGITHFLEHVSMTATEKWPDKRDLTELIELYGGSPNASTGYELLKYYITVPAKKADFALDYLFQTTHHCSFNPEYIEQERTIILDEISKAEDDLDEQAYIYGKQVLYTRKSGYQKEISGTKESVTKISREQLQVHAKFAHDPSHLKLIVQGNFDTTRMKKQLESTYGSLTGSYTRPPFPEESLSKGTVATKASEKSGLILSAIAYPYHAGSLQTTEEGELNALIHTVLSGPMSSRLIQRLREKEGLLYSIGSGTDMSETFGSTGISFRVLPHLYEKVMTILLEELARFSNDGITEKELKHYKEYIINRKYVRYDTFFDLASLIRSPFLWKLKIMTLEERIAYISSITVGDVNKKIQEMFDPQISNIIAFGKVTEETELVLKRLHGKYVTQ